MIFFFFYNGVLTIIYMVNNFYHQVSNSSTLKFDDFNDAVEQP